MADLLYDESDPWGWYFAALDNKALIAAMSGHILEEGELVGTYAR